MNLNDIHDFLVQWGSWNNEEFALMGFASPTLDHKTEYPDVAKVRYPESAMDSANEIIRQLEVVDRIIIKGIYLDGAGPYIRGKYNKAEIEQALRAFRDIFEMVEVA